jgi:uncharacterized protein YjgD (DUF1641 family)
MFSENSPSSDSEAAERLEKARQLVHSAAQPLTSIMTLLDLISTSPALDQETNEDIAQVYQEALNLKQIFHELQEAVSRE